MKVLVLSSFGFSLVNFRGKLLAAMVRAGHDVVACAPDNDPDVIAKLAMMGIGFAPTPMARASSNPLSDLDTLSTYLKLMAREKPDLVLAYTQKPIIYGGIAARLSGNVPFYALMSGLGYVFSPAAEQRVWLRRAVRLLYRGAMRRARAMFVFNSDDHGELIAQGIVGRDQRVVQVPGSGVDLAHFAAAPIPEGPPIFLMIARLMRDKGLFEFVEAARKVKAIHPKARFQLLGRIDAENPTSVDRAAIDAWVDAGLIEYFEETRDVRPILRASSVFVLPSYYREGLPRTILEAMAVGRAVVTTDMPGCRDPIEDGVNGWIVPPRDADALSCALMRFAEDPHMMARMGSASRRIAEERYDVDKVNALLLAEMALDVPPHPAPAAPQVPGLTPAMARAN